MKTSKLVVRQFVAPVAIVATLLFTGCVEDFSSGIANEVAVDGKFRHPELMDRADRSAAGKRQGQNPAEVAIKIEPVDIAAPVFSPTATTSSDAIDESGLRLVVAASDFVLDKQKILRRYEILSRYKILRRYEYSEVFDGFAIEVIDSLGLGEYDEFIRELLADPEIAWFEPDFGLTGTVPAKAVGQQIPWSIASIGGPQPMPNPVELFVVDSGVSNGDLNVVENVAMSPESGDASDLDGHGTHIAATAAAADNGTGLVGIAPGANVHNIKVLDDLGQTFASTVIAAVEHAVVYKIANPNTPVVLNLSIGEEIGSQEYTALDNAVAAAVSAGVTVVVAAGNEGIDASTVTPAHVSSAITVGAYEFSGVFAPFSNFGSMVDILAPGVDIVSLASSATGETGFAEMSGTSMATAHVSGAAAAFLSANPNASPAQVREALVLSAKSFVIGTPPATTNSSVWVGDVGSIKVPPFFQYAVTSDGTFVIGSADVRIAADPDNNTNANIFANGNIQIKASGSSVLGFGYHAGNAIKTSVARQTFQPAHNPAGIASTILAEPIDVPTFIAPEWRGVATTTTEGDLDLSGAVELGTRVSPKIWYVDGNLRTTGPTSISGYGVFVVSGNVELYHSVATTSGTDESTLGFYTSGNVKFGSAGISIAAQIFSAGNPEFADKVTLFGSVTTKGNVELKGSVAIHYRPANPILTDPFWPMGVE